MARETAARKRRRAPDPIQAIEIALDPAHAAKRSQTSKNWRHAMSLRSRVMFRRLFAVRRTKTGHAPS